MVYICVLRENPLMVRLIDTPNLESAMFFLAQEEADQLGDEVQAWQENAIKEEWAFHEFYKPEKVKKNVFPLDTDEEVME